MTDSDKLRHNYLLRRHLTEPRYGDGRLSAMEKVRYALTPDPVESYADWWRRVSSEAARPVK